MYSYDDEDNAPMNDDAMREDPWLKYTTYSCKAEADAWENGDIDRHLEDLENARDIRRSQIYEGFLDDLEIPRGSACRECPWMKEGIMEEWEHEVDDDLMFSSFVYDLAHRMCAVCNEHKDDDENARYDAIQNFLRRKKTMTELQELMKQKREIEKQIKILTTGSIVNDMVKIDRIGFAGYYQKGKWALFFKYSFIVSKGREGKAEDGTRWVPMINGDSFDDVVKRIPEAIKALTEIYEEAKNREPDT